MIRGDYGFLRIPRGNVSISSHQYIRSAQYSHDISGDVNFDCLVQVTSAGSVYCKLLFPHLIYAISWKLVTKPSPWPQSKGNGSEAKPHLLEWGASTCIIWTSAFVSSPYLLNYFFILVWTDAERNRE